MKLVIDIPEKDIPKNLGTMVIHLSFCDGTISQCNYPFEVLPKGHGRLIDADELDTSVLQAGFAYAMTRSKLRYTAGDVRQKIANAPTIIEADNAESEDVE